MRYPGALFLIGLTAVSTAAAQPAPAELADLVVKAGLDRPVAAWCRGEFRSGHPGAFAVAVTAAAGGGRYLVLETDSTVTELATFSRSPELSCYGRAEAEELNAAIEGSLTIRGQIAPRWNTTVVCTFVDDTTSVCWQYSPTDRVFVRVGGWVT